MLEMKNNCKNDILIIADCLEDDYCLYRQLYLKLANRCGFKKENVFVVTEKTFKQLANPGNGKDLDALFTSMAAKMIIALSDMNNKSVNRSRSVYLLCNTQRKEPLKKIFSEDDLKMMHTQYFGHYESVCNVREHPVTEIVCNKLILKDDVICTTNLVPNRGYLKELVYILNYLQNKKEAE